MLAVHNDELVIEEKGIYSIEKFLVARRLMYWQVYLHKTVLSAELMLIQVLNRAKHLVHTGWDPMVASPALRFFLENTLDSSYMKSRPDTLLNYFSEFFDVYMYMMYINIYM